MSMATGRGSLLWRRYLLGALFTVALVRGGTVSLAQPVIVMPNGTEFQVSTYTTNNLQFGRGVCHQADGSFVVVWGTGSGYYESIQGRRYASGGSPLGTEFQVNSYTGANADPAVCCNDDGFVVVWSGPFEFYSFFAGGAILGQRFDSNGAFHGTEFQVSAFTTYTQFASNSDICCSADGDFVVVWERGLFFFGPEKTSVLGQRFASSGAAQGTEFAVNSYTTGQYSLSPGVCCDAAGDFVVAWDRGGFDNIDVFGQRYASNGNPRGTEFQVNTYTSGFQGTVPSLVGVLLENQAICCDQAGDFVVAWTDTSQLPEDTIFAQRFASGGAFRGTEFQVSSYTTNQASPSVCCGPAGDFVIAWQEGSAYFTAPNLAGRRFSSNGSATGPKFQINTYSTSNGPPAISCDPSGGFVVTWFADATGTQVFGQRFKLAIGLAPAPTLSFFGLATCMVGLLVAAARGLRRRRR